MLRIVKKWSIKPLIYVCFAIALGLTVIVEAQVAATRHSYTAAHPSRCRAHAEISSDWRGTWAL
jgi:hypothetical protein